MDTLDVDLSGWLGKRKIGRSEPHLQFFLKEALEKIDHSAFQVGKADVLIHH